MLYVLVIIYGFMGSAVGQDVILEASLLRIKGYFPELVLCLPGIKPVVK